MKDKNKVVMVYDQSMDSYLTTKKQISKLGIKLVKCEYIDLSDFSPTYDWAYEYEFVSEQDALAFTMRCL